MLSFASASCTRGNKLRDLGRDPLSNGNCGFQPFAPEVGEQEDQSAGSAPVHLVFEPPSVANGLHPLLLRASVWPRKSWIRQEDRGIGAPSRCDYGQADQLLEQHIRGFLSRRDSAASQRWLESGQAARSGLIFLCEQILAADSVPICMPSQVLP